jgi:hypothetical protein
MNKNPTQQFSLIALCALMLMIGAGTALAQSRDADSTQVAQAGAAAPTPTPTPTPAQGERPAPPPEPVGQAPEKRALEVAPLFEQPGVLTPARKFVFEPSFQYAYSTSNRVALVGYTIIPAIVIGLIDVREVKRTSLTTTLAGRYGVTNRLEVEWRLPYVLRSDDSVGRELGSGASDDTVFNAKGHAVGDIEFIGRSQLTDGGLDKPYVVGSLRIKTRTGKDPFEVTTRAADGSQLQLPTGSGFVGLQPALTVLFPSDPAVLFGTVSYLHSMRRNNVVAQTDQGPRDVGTVEPGGVFGLNFGMGLALNERSSFSIGYDHSIVDRTKINGEVPRNGVRIQLATLLLGYAYRMNDKQTLNLSLGAGLTTDTPSVTLTLRLPITF